MKKTCGPRSTPNKETASRHIPGAQTPLASHLLKLELYQMKFRQKPAATTRANNSKETSRAVPASIQIEVRAQTSADAVDAAWDELGSPSDWELNSWANMSALAEIAKQANLTKGTGGLAWKANSLARKTVSLARWKWWHIRRKIRKIRKKMRRH